MTDVTIRVAGAEALDSLEPLWLALHEHHQRVAPPAVYQPPAASWRARRGSYEHWLAEGGFVLLAERGSDLVGYALVEIQDGPDDTWVTGSRIAEVQTLSVAPAERGLGTGTRLLDAVDAHLAELGIEDVFIGVLTGNDDALRFYERRGLRPVMTYVARFKAGTPKPMTGRRGPGGAARP
ncbi:GNAT family N-acetyltransferase [Yinghuangia seranimata]|uniref:GNAT family N-acetyltransferase n=1 Tax=Yinghuangia seranimata TaxID=408067 RepID=UPI00248AF30F|nr:GNAT family N-acetyltransferase [Yinghuangia seranimata]MDI2130698.1 GNAT family N-acetyltransferase [Yinghuangia seranimata]